MLAPEVALADTPAWTYWEPVEPPLLPASGTSTELSLSTARISRSAGLESKWTAASAALRDALVSRGFAVAPAAHPGVRLGDFYASLRDDRIPWVLTLDALFFIAHLALDRALAEVDAYVLAPLLATMLHHLDVRLAAESRAAGADLTAPYAVARGIVAVALSLAEVTYEPGPSIAHLVAEEKARAVAHAQIAVSPWLGVPIDYTAMAPEGMADRDEVRAGWFRAASWLQGAWLALQGAGEREASGHVDVATARVHARAALLLARLLDADVDPEAAGAWARIERASELVIGGPEDLTPRDLAAAAARAELDPRSVGWMANVVRLDHVRHAVARGRHAPAFRLLGPRATPDSELLQSLTLPVVGPRIPTDAPGLSEVPNPVGPPVSPRSAVRVLPTALDVAAWLGSGEARAALHDSGDDGYEHYEETLERWIHARPADTSLASSGRHRTLYLSMIDAIETWLMPSVGDRVQPGASTSEWRKRKGEVALSAWTELRHDATTLTRIPEATARRAAAAADQTTVPMFVEPHPEAIAKLAGLVRQTARALVSEGMLRSGSAALHVLDEVDDLLWVALGVSVYETADAPLPPSLESTLANFPARLSTLEETLAATGAADVPLVVAVHLDVASGRVLAEGTGSIEEGWVVMREPGTHQLWMALGASIPHYEFVEPASRRPSDTEWRTRLRADGEPAPGALARAYVFSGP
jgi:hypothetical protein